MRVMDKVCKGKWMYIIWFGSTRTQMVQDNHDLFYCLLLRKHNLICLLRAIEIRSSFVAILPENSSGIGFIIPKICKKKKLTCKFVNCQARGIHHTLRFSNNSYCCHFVIFRKFLSIPSFNSIVVGNVQMQFWCCTMTTYTTYEKPAVLLQ